MVYHLDTPASEVLPTQRTLFFQHTTIAGVRASS